ncbi:hypothetical protein [Pseudoalteromonas ruthenica]|uniref:hypothetical protein n=1 Tax=Pseudoalteromonas ruthenica TaxID=151081 RepID=UPI0003B45517|nr:hypothetical protein [Pseudoalteromonas ruthenica]
MRYKFLNWAALRVLGESKALKLTFLTPIFGYFVLFNDFFIGSLESFFSGVGFVDSNAFATQNAIFLYFGCLLLALANGLYVVFSPSVIKEYASNRHYLNENVEYVTLSRIRGLASHVNEEFGKGEEHNVVKVVNSLSDDDDLKTPAINLFNHFWNQSNYSKPMHRLIISVVFVVGFLVLLIPSAKLLLNVICSL